MTSPDLRQRRSALLLSAVLLLSVPLACSAQEGTSVGDIAPEIVGEDVDGNPMKLSDYRGKVVMIDFWGDW
ncbi:MAG: hypothetical protein R6W82_01275 [bacterium]